MAVLVALTVTLGVLQYLWIGEVSLAERERMRAGLQGSLHRLSQDFNADVTAACAALLPDNFQSDDTPREDVYAARYALWKESSRHNRLFLRVAFTVRQNGTLALRSLDPASGAFLPAEWPAAWRGLLERFTARFSGEPPEPPRPFDSTTNDLAVLTLPSFRRPEGGRGFPRPGPPDPRNRPETEWLIVELDLGYVRGVLLPELLQRHLGSNGKLDYQVEIVPKGNPSTPIYESEPGRAARIGDQADASVSLFELQYEQLFRRAGMFRGREPSRSLGRGRGPAPEMPDRGRWQLSVRHQAGSLEAVVDQVRWRNLAVTTGILILMLAAIAALVQFTRRAQKLARLEMEFVAGVSHELRTPLSVIRTAAHNLCGGVVSNTRQVQRYGTLIREEAERLTAIVEQVLRFASSKAGQPIGGREPVAVQTLIEDALSGTASVLAESRCVLEKRVEPELPLILADPIALKHALQNLLTNAAKYGAAGGWIGISSERAREGQDPVVEIRVTDRGPGIPPEELGQIFDPFYRGKRALEHQIHGTGLGLNLVKRIIEAHEGTVAVSSEPGKGTEFVLRIPAAPADRIDEFANSVSRG